jgi:hypothetical protein
MRSGDGTGTQLAGINQGDCLLAAPSNEWFLKVKVSGIELADFNQPAPVSDNNYAIAKIHSARGSKSLQSSVHRGNGHTERFSQLSKADRRLAGIIFLGQVRRTSTIEQFAKEMSHTCLHGSCAIIRNGFSKNSSVN